MVLWVINIQRTIQAPSEQDDSRFLGPSELAQG
jgi:hypothetical protein